MDSPPFLKVTDFVTDADVAANGHIEGALGAASGLGVSSSKAKVWKEQRKKWGSAAIPGVEGNTRFCQVLPPPGSINSAQVRVKSSGRASQQIVRTELGVADTASRLTTFALVSDDYACARYHASHPHTLWWIQWDCCRTWKSHKWWTWCRSCHRGPTTGWQARGSRGPLATLMFWQYDTWQRRARCCLTPCMGVLKLMTYKCYIIS